MNDNTEYRKSRTSWDDNNMLLALAAAQRSPDPNTQVGCFITTPDNRPVSLGYNGTPRGISPKQIPWARKAENPIATKYLYICHAEENAIYNVQGRNLNGCIAYSTLFPCAECMKAIIQVGIREVVYLDDLYPNIPSTKASKYMADIADLHLRKYNPTPEVINAINSIKSRLAE